MAISRSFFKIGWLDLISVIALSCILYVFSNISLFGLNSLIDRQSQDIFNILLGKAIYEQTGRDEYAVVLIMESTLRQEDLQQSWPYTPDSYAALLDSLIIVEPKSVFIDIQWKDMGLSSAQCNANADGQFDGLIQSLNFYEQAHIPVYIPRIDRQDTCQLPGELLALTRQVSVDLLRSKYDGVSRAYPLKTKQGQSAALALCLHSKKNSKEDTKEGIKEDCGAEQRSVMDVIWGMKKNPLNDWMDKKGQTEEISNSAQGSEAIAANDTQLAGANDETFVLDGKQAILNSDPYSTFLLAEDIISPLSDDQDAENQDRQAFKDVYSRLHDKTVFVGVNLIGSGDYVYTPNGQIRPGVFYHAMAYDNLLSFNGDFKDSEESGVRNLLKYITILFLSWLSIVYSKLIHGIDRTLLLRRYRHRYSQRLFAQFLLSLPTLAFIGISSFIVVLSSAVSFCYLNQAPSAWLGYLGLIFVGIYASKLELFSHFKYFLLYVIHADIKE